MTMVINEEPYDNVNELDREEPATVADVVDGGVIGAVGGAIVGGFAAGPIGAILGAVVGGAASAGAVGIVDKYDNDYEPNTDAPAHADVVDRDPVLTADQFAAVQQSNIERANLDPAGRTSSPDDGKSDASNTKTNS
jgi:hypothetical protein